MSTSVISSAMNLSGYFISFEKSLNPVFCYFFHIITKLKTLICSPAFLYISGKKVDIKKCYISYSVYFFLLLILYLLPENFDQPVNSTKLLSVLQKSLKDLLTEEDCECIGRSVVHFNKKNEIMFKQLLLLLV